MAISPEAPISIEISMEQAFWAAEGLGALMILAGFMCKDNRLKGTGITLMIGVLFMFVINMAKN